MRRSVYLDYAATTPLQPPVREAMAPYLDEDYGNPSSFHAYGRNARMAVEEARRGMLELLGRRGGRLVFTGSGSEADNLAVLGFARRHPGGRLVRSAIEHKAVIEPARALADGGYDVRVAPVGPDGAVDVAALADLLPDDGQPTLVSVMWANNEIGVIQPVEEIAALCRERGALWHSDAVQAFGKVPLDLEAAPVDLLAVSAHKIGGPKGVGALLIGDGVELEPLIYGGGQESGLRSGTLDVAGIIGLSTAAGLATARLADAARAWTAMRERLEAGLREALPDLAVNGEGAAARLPHVLNVSVPGVDIEGLLTALDLEGICVSSGSACTTGSVEPSHVLRAMGYEGERARNSVRMSLGWGTRAEEIEYVVATFPKVVQRVREFAAELKSPT